VTAALLATRYQAGAGKEAQIIDIEKIKTAAEEVKKTTDRLWRGVQDGLANAIENAFTKGIKSAQDFFNALGSMILKVFSEGLAAGITNFLKKKFGGSLTSAFSGGAGGANEGTSGLPTAGAAAGEVAATSMLPVVGVVVAAGMSIIGLIDTQNAAMKAANDAFFLTSQNLNNWIKTQSSNQSAGLQQIQTTYGDKFAAAMTAMNADLAAQKISIGGYIFNQQGHGNVGGTIPNSALDTTDPANLLKMIAAVKAAQGSGINVAADRALAQTLQDLTALEISYEAAVAKQVKTETESLAVRTLRNQGNTQAADLLAKQQADKIEMDTAIADHMNDAYIASLKWNQSIEETAIAMGTASTAALNMVSGYKLQATIFGAMAAHGGGSSGPYTPPTSQPYTPPSPTGATGTIGGDLTVNVVMPDGTVLGKAVLKSFKAIAQRQSGDSSKWSLIQ
jgi:hypothetical protein